MAQAFHNGMHVKVSETFRSILLLAKVLHKPVISTLRHKAQAMSKVTWYRTGGGQVADRYNIDTSFPEGDGIDTLWHRRTGDGQDNIGTSFSEGDG